LRSISGRAAIASPSRYRRSNRKNTSPAALPASDAAWIKLKEVTPSGRRPHSSPSDALRALHPDERIYTFWKYFRNAFGRDAALRIDHLLLSPPLAKRLISAGVDRDVRGREKATDHAPAWIELAEPTRTPRGFSSERDAPEAPAPTRFCATKSLAIEYAKRGIRVNAVALDIIKTPMHPAETHAQLAALHPVGHMGEISDIVEAVLCLESASFVTGEILHVDGGQSAGH
jgi:hypothetical protein